MSTPKFSEIGFSFPLPAILLSRGDGWSEPFGTTLKSEGRKDIFAPVVVSFSSRGPSPLKHDILKPDLPVSGVDILAAWSPLADETAVDFNIISGTSMSCLHVSGAAAYVKSANPQWSPAAIKSALKTTGHINPVRVVDAGLVFDLSEQDYVKFLCSQGYNASKLRLVTSNNNNCSPFGPGRVWDLNYPSFALSVLEGQAANTVFHRKVTNVAAGNVTYYAGFTSPPSLTISVEPTGLFFLQQWREEVICSDCEEC